MAGSANAITNPRIGDNPESPQSIEIRRQITNATDPVTNRFTYEIFDAENSGLIQHITNDIVLEANEEQPNEDGIVEIIDSFDVSDMQFFGIGGIRTLGLREIASENQADYPVSDTVYYFKVAVKGDVDEYGWQTGDFVATLVLPFEGEDGAKYDAAIFKTSHQRTHIELQTPPVGNGVKATDVYRYEVIIYGEEGEIYDIIAPKNQYEYEGETVKSDKKCEAGKPCVIYLAPGESATVGVGADGKDQIRNSTRYQVKYTVSQKEEIIEGDTEPEPVIIRPVGPKTDVSITLIPFAILAVVAAIGIIVVFKIPKN